VQVSDSTTLFTALSSYTMTFTLPSISSGQYGINMGGIASSFMADLQGVANSASKADSPPAILQSVGSSTTTSRRRMQGTAPAVEITTCSSQAQVLAAQLPGTIPSTNATVQGLLTQAQANALLLLFYQGGFAASPGAFSATSIAYQACLQRPFSLAAAVSPNARGAVQASNSAPWAAYARPGDDLTGTISALVIVPVVTLLGVLTLAIVAGSVSAAAAQNNAAAAAAAAAGAVATLAKA